MAERSFVEMKIKGKPATVTQRMSVEKGTRQPKVPFTPYLKVEPGPYEIAEKMAANLMYCEIMMFFHRLLTEISDDDFNEMLFKEINGRIVARRLMDKVGRLPKEIPFDESKLPDNPFSIGKPGFALHEIIEQREKLIKKNELNPMEKLWLYRLRIAELLWIVTEGQDHMDWLEEDYKKLEAKLAGNEVDLKTSC